MQWRLHFGAAVPQQQLRQRRQNRVSSGILVVGVLVLLAWNLSGISIAPGRLVYSKVPVGQGKVRSVELQNRSSSDVHALARVLGEAASDFSLINEACATIRAGENCKLAMEFRPRIPGPRSANLVVLLEGYSEPYKVTLRGEGIPHPTPSPTHTPEPPTPAPPTSEPPTPATPTPATPTPATPTPATPTPATPTPTTPTPTTPTPTTPTPATPTPTTPTPGLPAPEPPTPASPTREPSTPEPPTPAPTRPLTSSNPLPEAMVHIEPIDLVFDTERRRLQQVYIANDGDAPLRVNAAIGGADADQFRMDQPCMQVAAHGKCIITVRLEPHLALDKSEYVAVLRLDHNGSNKQSPQNIGLHFRAQKRPEPARLAAEPRNLSFSGVTNGRTASTLPGQTVAIRNPGPGTSQNLSIRLGLFDGSENKFFSYTSNCHKLDPDQTCQVKVDFSAAAAKTYNGILYVSDGLTEVAVHISATLTLRASPNPSRQQKNDSSGSVEVPPIKTPIKPKRTRPVPTPTPTPSPPVIRLE
jgi:hypothetical protein